MRHIRLAFFGCTIALSAGVTGCGGNSSQNSAGSIPLNQAPNALISSYCDGFGTCCGSKGFAFDGAKCDANLHSQMTSSSLCPAPGIYDPQAAAECFAQIQATYATCSPNHDAMPACQRICTGNQPVGGSCASSHDCAPPANGTGVCMTNASGAAGICIERIRAQAGDACNDSCVESDDGFSLKCSVNPSIASYNTSGFWLQCFANDGLYCASDRTCKPTIALGGTCAGQFDCQLGAHCNFTSSMCEANFSVGASCSNGNGCVDTAYCDSNYLCAIKKPEGATCTINSDECAGRCDTATGLCKDYGANGLSGFEPTADHCANPGAS